MAKKHKPVEKWEPKIIEEHLNKSGAKPVNGETLLERVKETIFKKYDFRYNETRQVMEFRLNGSDAFFDFDSDMDLNSMWIDFQLDKTFHPKEKPAITLLQKILFSRFVPKFNPILSYFDALKWDGKDHITELAETVKVTPIKIDDKFTAVNFWPELLQRWLICAAACGIGKGANHVMLLFIGDQGTGKTTWLKNLVPNELYNYSHVGHIDPTLNNNTTCDQLAEKFILNVDDQLETIFGKSFNMIKSIITAPDVSNRKSYRRDAKKRARIANFVGSVNTERIFQDVENRRYLTFKIENIEYKHKVDINQVWAQAYELVKNGERHWFTQADKEVINTMNEQFSQVSEEEEWLMKMYRPVDETSPYAQFIMFSEILSNINAASGLRLSKYRLEIAMKKLSWDNRVNKRTPDGPRYVYSVQPKFDRGEFGSFVFTSH